MNVSIRSHDDPTRKLALGSQRDMNQLVSELQEGKAWRQIGIGNDAVELFLMPKAQSGAALAAREAKFVTSNGIRIILRLEQKAIESLCVDHFVTIELTQPEEEFPVQRFAGQWLPVTDGTISSRQCTSNWSDRLRL